MLRAVDFGESDRIVRLLTPGTARLTVMAKGARRSKKRFPGTIDLFNHLAVQVEQRRPTSMARLEHTRLIDPLEGLRTRPGRFALACTCVELVDRLAPEGVGGRESRRLFDATLSALRATSSRPADARLRALLELRLLDALGLRPELGRCVRCARALGDDARVRFHVGEGGPLCARCTGAAEAAVPVHLGTLRALALGLRLPVERLDRLSLSRETLAEARVLLGRFKRFHVGIELRSERFADAQLAPADRSASA